jgi:Family of unknown function (DUF5675)
MNAILNRVPSTDQGTFGIFTLDDNTTFYSIELPWRNNDKGLSCIPAGAYHCHWINSPKHGWCYQVMDVPNRDMIEIHSANWAGDAAQGFVSQLLGCIALGDSIGILNGQLCVLHSKDSIATFEQKQMQQDFVLTIKE